MQRMRELSVQAANDTLTQQDRSYIQEEVSQLRDEITRIGNTTQFNTKKLLNGDAAALWSSDNASTKAIINGGLRTIDQFGQKSSAEGNYKITIKADPGQTEIQKSDIFRVKHPNTIGIESKSDKVTNVTVDNVKANTQADATVNATYTVAGSASAATLSGAVMDYTGTQMTLSGATSGANTELAVEFKDYIQGNTSANGSATFHVSGWSTNVSGAATWVEGDVTITLETGATNASGAFASGALSSNDTAALRKALGDLTISGFNVTTAQKNSTSLFKSSSETGSVRINVSSDAGGLANGVGNATAATHAYNLDTGAVSGQDISLKHLYLDDAGKVQTGTVTLSTKSGIDAADLQTPLAKFEVFEVGDVANENVKLRDLEKFWDSEGNFMLEDPQTITLNQADGKSASVTLYGYDTIEDVRKKLNDAIGDGLGQNAYLASAADTDHFVTFVTDEKDNTSESVEGTFLIRTLVPGESGKISMSGDENVINAFSLNTIQDATESTYKATVQDAHTGQTIAKDVQVTGNKLIGVINPNVDVEFDALGGVTATWNDAAKKFGYETKDYETTLHLSDNTTVFQIGANEGEDMGINIGDMRASALGLDAVNVTNREVAARSITVIDNAIDKVSMQRSKLGAYQNRLEHTVNNLTTSSENLTAAESRIRDTDMAKEMLNFSKLQIMLQAGNSMLSQANQLPQNVLSLIR
jgi:flagellin